MTRDALILRALFPSPQQQSSGGITIHAMQ
jgi:hypothetical protein